MELTFFAPANRSTEDELEMYRDALREEAKVPAVLEHHPTPTVLMTPTRQIVYANAAFRAMDGATGGNLVGKRLGDALRCVQVDAAPSGCGTGEACAQCGAVRAVVNGFEAQRLVQEECCFQRSEAGLDGDFLVSAYPVAARNLKLIAVAMDDISAEKRRSALERTFFHDVLNTAAGIQGVADLFVSGELQEHETREFFDDIHRMSRSLVEEIQHQRKLMLAERGELEVERRPVELQTLLHDLQREHQASPAARGRVLRLLQAPVLSVVSDRVLLKRIAGNLIKNALEATPVGGTVSFWCEQVEGGVRLSVHNAGEIPEAVQSQLFHRSFSTKGGSGRGIGTYSVKMFAERYLGGRVEFASDAAEGTRFNVTLPLQW